MYTPAAPRETRTYRHFTISTIGLESATQGISIQAGSAVSSLAWPLANLALYVPIYINETVTVYEGGIGAGATAGGNFDIGIYDAAGTRIVSSGSTVRTASAWNVAALTDTELQPGWYYAAMSANGTNNYSGTAPNGALCAAMGVCEQQTAFALPATATLTITSRALVPNITFAVRSIAL